MAETLKDWLKSDTVKELDEARTDKLMRYHFFRDECRATCIDKNIMFSPADGVILYQKILRNKNDGLIEIKGKEYTLDEAIDSMIDIEYPCIVIGIFMTAYDVHINRMPTAGILSHYKLEPISSYNKPMLAEEKKLLGKEGIGDLRYLFNNERVLNKVYEPQLNLKYYFMQIADYDVRMIIPFEDKQTRSMLQSERMGMIRWGSQCDLIIPYSKKYDFELLQGEMMHVKAGYDALIRIKEKQKSINERIRIKNKKSNNMLDTMLSNINNSKKYIEAEDGEFILKNSAGDIAIIPSKDKDKIQNYIDENNNEAIDSYVSKLPKYESYAENGTTIPNPNDDFTILDNNDDNNNPPRFIDTLKSNPTPEDYKKITLLPLWATKLKETKDTNLIIGNYTGDTSYNGKRVFTFNEAINFPKEIKDKLGITVLEEYFNKK